ncbi:hypothetical protein CW304_16800 [Bacillus sp. UFRGS-B20]|nr:hypothetical protein CW304_16800 [Bacillus sp. UFRGS-B20]
MTAAYRIEIVLGFDVVQHDFRSHSCFVIAVTPIANLITGLLLWITFFWIHLLLKSLRPDKGASLRLSIIVYYPSASNVCINCGAFQGSVHISLILNL